MSDRDLSPFFPPKSIAVVGAVANDDAAIDAFCASCGIVRGREPAPAADRRQDGMLWADRASLEGLTLGALPKAFAEIQRQRLPPEASAANPIEDRFGFAFEAAMSHATSAYDMIMMIHVVIARLRDGVRSDNLSDVRFRDRRGV
jgi:acyl-CoA synthetase (NDP forming)